MTKRDFFRVLIKLFGLYSCILTVFNFIPTNISYAISNFQPLILLWIVGASALTIALFFLLIFKADKIIDFLKLDKGFDNDSIVLKNFNESKIIKLALIIIGGFLVIENIPDFLSHSYYAFKNQISFNISDDAFPFAGNTEVDYFRWFFAAINILLGYLLLTNYSLVSKWLSKPKNQKDID